MMLLMYHLYEEKFMYNLSGCGNNCAKWLPSITSDRDVVCSLAYPMIMVPTNDWQVLCLNNNTMMKSEEEYRKYQSMYCCDKLGDLVFARRYCVI